VRFLLVDRITELDSGRRATGLKNVTLSEDFFAFHFPFHPIMPGALIAECLVQLADWIVREGAGFECIATPSAFESLKFYRLVRPGDQLKLEVELFGRDGTQSFFRGQASCGDEVVAVGRFAMNVRPAGEFLHPEEARKIYAMIVQR
jgi:3-hydroxyacyl-[acyl-carrier-protein] dehydratase